MKPTANTTGPTLSAAAGDWPDKIDLAAAPPAMAHRGGHRFGRMPDGRLYWCQIEAPDAAHGRTQHIAATAGDPIDGIARAMEGQGVPSCWSSEVRVAGVLRPPLSGCFLRPSGGRRRAAVIAGIPKAIAAAAVAALLAGCTAPLYIDKRVNSEMEAKYDRYMETKAVIEHCLDLISQYGEPERYTRPCSKHRQDGRVARLAALPEPPWWWQWRWRWTTNHQPHEWFKQE